jgi:hypothetical protein
LDIYTRILALATIDTRGPLSNGVWGTGKASLMRMIERHLAAEDENVVTV